MHFSSRLSTNTETSMLSKNTLNMESASKNPMRVKRINKSDIFIVFLLKTKNKLYHPKVFIFFK